ncbi:MAG: hypothetical protein DCC55_35065, partial [Chloroflexi bacterium]
MNTKMQPSSPPAQTHSLDDGADIGYGFQPVRRAHVERTTKETQITLDLTVDGRGQAQVSTGIGFLDHMLTLLAGHGLFDLIV